MPSGSLTATPMRTLPTSTPTRRPRPGSSLPGRSGSRCSGLPTWLAPAYLRAEGGQRRVDARGPLAGALRHVGLAAAAAVHCRTQRLDQIVGREPEILGGRVDGDHERDAVVLPLGDQRDDRRLGADLAADITDETAQIRGRCPSGHPLRHDTDLTDLLGARRGVHRGRPRTGEPHPVEFLLRVFNLSTSWATRAGPSSDGTFSDDARPAIRARSLARWRNESSPT